ncbi:ribosomal protein L11 [Cylindrobasidium torrendii FP15055 ss-10]|uniref:Large ribosomal subunit protein uL11m n=1 Tax=Cylindrobasidium torrendii FP15055 ss-10 TaxID=1314674 RepID=A0A0D7BRP9_9AGAR|nr:ribosomal protein L11 [Cylindrobasidium torrendii FP15055 ss-10]
MAAKAVGKDQFVRLMIGAGKAAPTPPVGPALGARGVKSMDFCKEFNAKTANITPGTPTPTEIYVRGDRSFYFVTKTPPTTWLLKQAAGIKMGTGKPGHVWNGTVSLKHIYEIARIKSTDNHMKHIPLESVARMVVGSARSLGVKVVP